MPLLRRLIRQPGFSGLIILTAALGIGTATSAYSIVYAILLRPFPYNSPERLVRVQSRDVEQGGALRGCSLLDIEDYRRRATMIENIGAFTSFETQITGDGPNEVGFITQANPAAINILGVTPVLGRLLQPSEDVPGGDVHKALISYSLWQTRFGSDPLVIGQSVRTDRRSYTIAGVMPPGFGFPRRTEMWTPMESYYAMQTGDRAIKRRDSRFYSTVARVKPGVTLAQAEADLNAVAEALEREYPKENRGIRVKLTAMREFEVGQWRSYLHLLMAGVGFVLLACAANIAGLLLVRGAVTRRELTLRTALGASRARLIRDQLAECLALTLAGGLVGVGLAYAAVAGVAALMPSSMPLWMSVRIDRSVLMFCLLVTLATSLVVGLAPALAATRLDVNRVLKDGPRGSSRLGLRGGLVVTEIALSVLLLVCAMLLTRTLIGQQRVDAGFRADGLLTVRTVKYQGSGTRLENAAALSASHAQVLDALRRIPGVASAAVTNSTQSERTRADLAFKGRSREESKTLAPLAGADVSPDYFHAMGIPLRRGRLFDATGTTSSGGVVIVNERAVRLFWPNRDPIGDEVLWGQLTASNPYCRVVGVVGDVRHQAAEGDNGIELYYPVSQWPIANAYYVVRTDVEPQDVAIAVRRAIQDADPRTAVAEVKTMEARVAETLWDKRLWSVMFAVFAALSLTIGVVGLYGLMSHSVVQRTREIGIRMALGARPAGIGSMCCDRPPSWSRSVCSWVAAARLRPARSSPACCTA
jgi:putative ABC transport system permease protein